MEGQAGITVARQAEGLEMTLTLAGGPFFLRELLPVRVALRNHSARPIWYEGFATDRIRTPIPGQSALYVVAAGGTAPYYDLPWHPRIGGPRPHTTPLAHGAITMDFLVPLRASGAVTLTAQARLFAEVTKHEGYIRKTEVQLFPEGWPSVVIDVEPDVPPDRLLTLTQAGARLVAAASTSTAPELLYQYVVTCTSPVGHRISRGTREWQPLPADGLPEPACPGRDKHWQVMIAAPGYAIASASYG